MIQGTVSNFFALPVLSKELLSQQKVLLGIQAVKMYPPNTGCDCDDFYLEIVKLQNVTNDCSCQLMDSLALSSVIAQQGRDVNLIVE